MSTPAAGIDLGVDTRPVPNSRIRRTARGVFAVVVVFGVAMPILAGVLTRPVESVRITGEFIQVPRADIERVVNPLLAPGMLRIDLDALRHATLEIAWVRDVTIRRAWPDALEIAVIERVALARWAGGGFLERDGTHFRPAGNVGPTSLPMIDGPAGTQREVLDLHIALTRELAPLGIPLESTRLSRRGVVHATLRDGPRFVMRPSALNGALETCARTLANVMAGRLHEIESVDLRYPTGFTVRRRPGATNGEAQA